MSRLKKKAQGDFCRMCIMMILLLPSFGLAILLNFEGDIKYLFPALAGGGFIVAFTTFAKLRAKEESVQSYLQFDEREFYLFRKSQEWGNYCFVVFLSVAMMVLFLTAGSRGLVPVWIIPLILFSGIFLSETVRFIILMNYAREDDRSIEGGAA